MTGKCKKPDPAAQLGLAFFRADEPLASAISAPLSLSVDQTAEAVEEAPLTGSVMRWDDLSPVTKASFKTFLGELEANIRNSRRGVAEKGGKK
jgi:hypothetical protein